jgi:hypothetical protein
MGIRDYMGSMGQQRRAKLFQDIKDENDKAYQQSVEDYRTTTKSTPPFSDTYKKSLMTKSVNYQPATELIKPVKEEPYTKTYGSPLATANVNKNYDKTSTGQYAMLMDDEKGQATIIKLNKIQNKKAYYTDKNGKKLSTDYTNVFTQSDLKAQGYKTNKISPSMDTRAFAKEYSNKLGETVKSNYDFMTKPTSFTERVSQNIQNTALGETMPNGYDTGSDVKNTIADLIGQTLGYMAPQSGGASAFKLGEKIASELTPKLIEKGLLKGAQVLEKPVIGGVIKGATGGLASGVPIGLSESGARGYNLGETAKHTAEVAGSFAILGGAIGGAAGGLVKAKGALTKAVDELVPTKPISSSVGNEANVNLERLPTKMTPNQELESYKNNLVRTQKDIDQALIPAKEKYGEELKYMNVDKVKAETGVDIPALNEKLQVAKAQVENQQYKLRNNENVRVLNEQPIAKQEKIIKAENNKPLVEKIQVEKAIRNEKIQKAAQNVSDKQIYKQKLIKEKTETLAKTQEKFDNAKIVIKEQTGKHILALDKNGIAEIKKNTGIDIKKLSEDLKTQKKELDIIKNTKINDIKIPEKIINMGGSVKGGSVKNVKYKETKQIEPSGEFKQVKQTEIKETKPTEVKPAEVKNVKAVNQAEVKQIRPTEIKETKPTEVKPTEVKQIRPTEIKETKQAETKQVRPIRVKRIKPKEVMPTKESKFESTVVKSEITQKGTKKEISKRLPTEYETTTNQGDWEKAVGHVNANSEKVLSDLHKKQVSKGKWTSLDVSKSLALMEHYENIKDFKKVSEVLEVLTKESSIAGQNIQALTMWNRRSPSGILALAKKLKVNSLASKTERQLLSEMKLSKHPEFEKYNSEYNTLTARIKQIQKQLRSKGCKM